MKALIFAAGLGTRLKPLTDTRPKALVEIEGKTLLDITIDRLIRSGVTEIVVNVHHFADLMEQHISRHHYPVKVSISDERECLLDTGGGLRQAAKLFSGNDEPILIHNVDILHNADLKAFYEEARNHDVTLMVSPRKTSRYLLFDRENGYMKGWTNIQTGELRGPAKDKGTEGLAPYAFSGIHCISPHVLPLMDDFPETFPIMDFYISLCSRLNIRSYMLPGLRLLDVGKTAALQEAARFVSPETLVRLP